MTIPPFSGRIIRVRWPEALALAAALSAAAAAAPAPAKAGSDLAAAVAAAERGDPSAARRLAALAGRYPAIQDFLAYWRAQALAAGKRYEEAAAALAPVWQTRYPSPLAARAAALGADSLLRAGRARDALAMLGRLAEDQWPEPQASLIAARAREALGEKARAVSLYQRIWCLYPLAPEAAQAADALDTLSRDPALVLSPPPDELRAERAERLAKAGRFEGARQQWQALAREAASSAMRELAQVRAAAALYQMRLTREALAELQPLRPAAAETDAERLHYVLLCHRRLEDPASMMAVLEEIRRRAPASSWTLRSLIQAANYYLVRNDPSGYTPLFRACADGFPQAPEAAACHWKIAWRAWLERRSGAEELLREHLRRFPASDRAGAALYYLGISESNAGNSAAAEAFFSELRSRFPNYFYSSLTASRARPAAGSGGDASEARRFLASIQWPERPRSADFTPDEEAQWRIQRARILSSAALETWAEIELRFGARSSRSRYALALELARTASRRGAFGAAVRHIRGTVPEYLWLPRSAAPRSFWELAFPFPYRSIIEQHARRRGLDPLLVAALIRQESEFDPDAVSSAGAIGLMQVMPATGRQLGRRLKLGRITPRSLHRPATNVAIGTFYLARLIEQHQGRVEAALAAYNAGPSRVPGWLEWGDYREPAEFVETIPLAQTRDYVQIILRNLDFYRWLYGGAGPASAETGAAVPARRPAEMPKPFTAPPKSKAGAGVRRKGAQTRVRQR